eukprot:5273521-Pyramimonas_sp.AAC.1
MPVPQGWRRRGAHPILDALLWGVEAGWTYTGPASFTSRDGAQVRLADSPPTLAQKIFIQDLKKFLDDAMLRLLERENRPRALDIKLRGLWTEPIQ